MDVTIAGVTRSYEFDPAVPVGSDDEGEASLELLRDAETSDVQLVGAGAESAQVEVEVRVTVTVNLTVEMEDLGRYDIESTDDIARLVTDGDYDIDYDVESAMNSGDFSTEDTEILDVTVEAVYDEDGEDIDL
jgi:hypothetical protein